VKTIFVCALAASGLAGPLKQDERNRLIAHIEMTSTWLADEVSGLTQKQLTWKPSADGWSILNVVEHLNTAEPQYWQWVQDSLSKPVLLEKPSEVKDDAILWYGIDRTQRTKTAEARDAKGQLTDIAKGMEAFRKLRSTVLDFARTSEADLRGTRFRDSQMDVYQWLVMISSHSQRHILQIREIKASPGFPKSGS